MPRGHQMHDRNMTTGNDASPLLAIGRIVRILDALPDDAARRRVVCYVSDRWHDERDV